VQVVVQQVVQQTLLQAALQVVVGEYEKHLWDTLTFGCVENSCLQNRQIVLARGIKLDFIYCNKKISTLFADFKKHSYLCSCLVNEYGNNF